MSKIKKLLRAITLILQKPSLLNLVLNDEDVNKKQVIAKYNLPLGLPTIDLLELVPGFSETVSPFCALDGGSTLPDLALLKALAQSKKDCDYFEIGTWRGESVANVAAVAKQCTTMNLPDETMLAMGLEKDYVNSHRFFSKDLANVTHLQQDSTTFDFARLERKFDLIFIDGDHHYESVKQDTMNAFRLLRNENAVIVWHDYSHTPSSAIRWDVLRGILDGTPPGKLSRLYHVSNTLCAIYTNQPVHSKHPIPFEAPDKFFTLKIDAHRIV